MHTLRFVTVSLLLATGAALTLAQDSPPAADPANLLPNSNFEEWNQADKLPLRWSSNQPGLIKPDDVPDRGRVVQIKAPRRALAYYGIDLVTTAQLNLEPNTPYRCTGYLRSTGPRVHVLIEGYATVQRMIRGTPQTYHEAVCTIHQAHAPGEQWQPFALDFTMPESVQFGDQHHEIEYARVKLWAYWPAGICWIDDLRLQKSSDAAPVVDECSPALPDADAAPASQEDPEDRWVDAAKAYQVADYARALALVEDLVAQHPRTGRYRWLLSRTQLRLGRWSAAWQQADWLAGAQATTQPQRNVEPWQVEWVPVLRAEVLWNLGHADAARLQLTRAISPDVAPHVRRAAQTLQRQIDISERKPD